MKAFPAPATLNEQGMDLRDYFAAKAMEGLISLKEVHISLNTEEITIDNVVGAAYEWADAMMKARETK